MSRWSTLERELRRAGGPLIAGVDEVGRGSLAGPVVACAIVMPADQRAIAGVDDSKLLTPVERERLAERIRSRALALRVAAASAREVDALNIYHASVLAMRRALARLPVAPDHVLVDGRPIRTLGVPHRAVVGGDARCYAIACASIVAKVTRDFLMARLAERYPEYRWERNCGYSTPDHIAALARFGPTVHHRRSFMVRSLAAPVGEDEDPLRTLLTDLERGADAPPGGDRPPAAPDEGGEPAPCAPSSPAHGDPDPSPGDPE